MKPMAYVCAIFIVLVSATTPTMAGVEPSPFQPAITIENNSDQLEVESPFNSAPLENVTIEFFYMGADGGMVLWGSYFIEAIESGDKFVADPADFNPSIPLDDIPAGVDLFAKGSGHSGRYPVMVFPEGTAEVFDIPISAPYVALSGDDSTGGAAEILPIFAFKTTDTVGTPTPGTMVGLAEPTFESVPDELPTKVKFPSPEAPTLQAAIDLVADGGTVVIKAGVYEVAQPLFIIEKRIKIKGAGSSRKKNPKKITRLLATPPTEVVEADAAVGVINFVGGGGVIKKLDIVGGDACVVARDSDSASNPVQIKNVVLGDTGRGILWQSKAQLTVKNTIIENCLWNGISVAPKDSSTPMSVYRANLIIKNSVIINPLVVGIYFSNAIGFVNDVTIHNSQAVAAYKSKVQVTNSRLYNNKISAITFWDSNLFNPQGAPPNLIKDNLVVNVDPDNNGAFGDGIGLFASDAEIIDNQIIDPSRSGVANFGSFAAVKDIYIFCAGLDINGESWSGDDWVFDDQGGNSCGCTDDPFHPCQVVSSSLEPPPPVGGLE